MTYRCTIKHECVSSSVEEHGEETKAEAKRPEHASGEDIGVSVSAGVCI